MPTIGEMLKQAAPAQKPRQSPLAGVLPAVFGAGDKLKRMASDFAADPIGNIQQKLGFLNDQAGQFNQLHSQATQEAMNAARTGAGIGHAQQKIASTLADAYNPIGMIKIPGRGQIPETASDVAKLSDRFDGLLKSSGVDYSFDKSGISPARYFMFENPSAPDEMFKVRISDHRNVHGADFSVDPHTGATFEEMMDHVRGLGVPLKNRVSVDRSIGKKVYDATRKALDFGEDGILRKASQKYGGVKSDAFKENYPAIERRMYEIANIPKDQYTKQHLDEVNAILAALSK